jgi:hypothetical protein
MSEIVRYTPRPCFQRPSTSSSDIVPKPSFNALSVRTGATSRPSFRSGRSETSIVCATPYNRRNRYNREYKEDEVEPMKLSWDGPPIETISAPSISQIKTGQPKRSFQKLLLFKNKSKTHNFMKIYPIFLNNQEYVLELAREGSKSRSVIRRYATKIYNWYMEFTDSEKYPPKAQFMELVDLTPSLSKT